MESRDSGAVLTLVWHGS